MFGKRSKPRGGIQDYGSDLLARLSSDDGEAIEERAPEGDHGLATVVQDSDSMIQYDDSQPASPTSTREQGPWHTVGRKRNNQGRTTRSLPNAVSSPFVQDGSSSTPAVSTSTSDQLRPRSASPALGSGQGSLSLYKTNWRDTSAAAKANNFKATFDGQRKTDPHLDKHVDYGKNMDKKSFTRMSGHTTICGKPISVIQPKVVTWHMDRLLFSKDHRVVVPQGGRLERLPSGEQVLHKGRFWVTLEVYGDELVEIPIYTFGDRGLQGASRDEHHEYAEMRPPHLSCDSFISKSKHNPVLGIAKLFQSGKLRETMLAHVAKPQSRALGDTAIRRVAMLDQESFEVLKRLVEKRRVPRG